MKLLIFILICFQLFASKESLSMVHYFNYFGADDYATEVFEYENNNDISFNLEKYDSLIKYLKQVKDPKISLEFKNASDSIINNFIENIDFNNSMTIITFDSCSFKALPKSLRLLPDLEFISFRECHDIETMNGFNTYQQIFAISFYDCNITKVPEGIEKLRSFLRLEFIFFDPEPKVDFNRELSKFSGRNNILSLMISYRSLNNFPEEIFKLTSLQVLVMSDNNITDYPKRFDTLNNLIVLGLPIKKEVVNYKQDIIYINTYKNSFSALWHLLSSYNSFNYDEIDKIVNLNSGYLSILCQASDNVPFTLNADTHKIIATVDMNSKKMKINIPKIKDEDYVHISITSIPSKEYHVYNVDVKDLIEGNYILDLSHLNDLNFRLNVWINGKLDVYAFKHLDNK